MKFKLECTECGQKFTRNCTNLEKSGYGIGVYDNGHEITCPNCENWKVKIV